jgi:hypothetical protein
MRMSLHQEYFSQTRAATGGRHSGQRQGGKAMGQRHGAETWGRDMGQRHGAETGGKYIGFASGCVQILGCTGAPPVCLDVT